MVPMNFDGQVLAADNGNAAARISVSVAEIPHYFDRESLCSMDVIAYVRRKGRFPDPRVPVILDADCAPFDKELLSGNMIFWGGPGGNEGDISIFSGLADNIYLPIYTDEFDLSQEDYGLPEMGAVFGMKYDISNYTVLLCGDCTDAPDDPLTCAWDYLRNNYTGPVQFDVATSVAEKQRRLVDGIDISSHILKLRQLRSTNELNHKTLMGIIGDIGDHVKSMLDKGINPKIQCLMAGHPQDVQLLRLYLSLKFNLSPLYVESYLQSYVDLRFNYDYKSMSLYERFRWAQNLPDEFGYLGPNVRFFCFCTLSDEGLFLVKRPPDEEEVMMSQHVNHRMSKTSAKRIYPVPLYGAYVNMQSGDTYMFKPDEVLDLLESGGIPEERRELFNSLAPTIRMFGFLNYGDILPLVDFRTSFRGSTEHFTDETSVTREARNIARSDSNAAMDKQTDEMWRRVFVSMAEQVRQTYNDQIYPTVKNSILCSLSPHEFLLLYCPGSLGLTCKLTSEYFDKDIQIIGEEDFHRFIDMRTLMALIEKTPLAGEQSFQEGNKRFAEIMTLDYRNLQPAVDYDVMLALHMLTPRNNGLSYYDKMLRSTVNIMPIVTDEDNPLYEPSELLKHFTYLNLLSADTSTMSLSTITCFGTLEDDINAVPVLQTTIESYRGCELL